MVALSSPPHSAHWNALSAACGAIYPLPAQIFIERRASWFGFAFFKMEFDTPTLSQRRQRHHDAR